MQKDSSLLVRICDFISKQSLYILVFLLPVFFLPLTSDALEFNKQTLLIFFVSLSLFAWMLKVLFVKEVSINLNKTTIAVAVLLFISAISTIFSLWRYGSFWGWPQIVSEGLITLVCLSVFYFLVVNIFKKKEIITSLVLLTISGLVVMLIGVFQSFGLFLIPLDFTKSIGFNTIGSSGNLGFFVIILLPLIITFLARKKALTIMLSLAVILSVFLLVTINYPVLWWLTIVGSALVMIFGIQKKELFDNRLLILPMFFLALSLFFIILKPSIGILPKLPVEVYLTQKTSLSIDWQTLKQNPVLGSGPGTFGYEFAKYKEANFNKSIFWNTRFNSAGSKVLNVLGTTGILGLLAFLALLGCIIYCGIKFFLIDKRGDESYWSIALSVFSGLLVLAVGFFLRNGSLTIDFLFFFLLACFIALIHEEKKGYKLEASSLTSLSVTFAFTLLFIFGLGLLILIGQKYVAEARYTSSIIEVQKGNIDAGVMNMQKAVSLNPSSDLYLRQLSQVYLLKLTNVLSDENLSDDQKSNAVQILVANAVNAAKIATDINSKNIINWSSRGSVYQSLIGVVPDASTWAINSYNEASKLDPNNPYYLNQKGIVYLQEALSLSQENQGDKPALLAQAKAELDKAVALKSDYASARFQLAMVAEVSGETDEAIKGLEETKAYAPNDVGLALQLGLLYYQEKDYSKAQAEFSRAITISPDYSNALYYSGLTYYKQGQNGKAIEQISRVFGLNPDNSTVKQVLSNLESGKDPLSGIEQGTTPVEESPKEK